MTPGLATTEREHTTAYLIHAFGKDYRVTEIQRDGYTLGYWLDADWDGHCPNSELVAAALSKSVLSKKAAQP